MGRSPQRRIPVQNPLRCWVCAGSVNSRSIGGALELRQLESLFWIVVLGSFGAAASRMNTTQPAISGRISALERELGVTLLDRSGRKVRLTPKGMEIYDYAEKVIGLKAAIRETALGKSQVRGTVRLGVINTVAHIWLPKLIGEVQRRYPEVDVDFQVDISASLIARLSRNELDLIVAVGQVTEPGTESRFLTHCSLDWVASAKLDLGKEPVSLAELARHRIITYPRHSMAYRFVCDLFKSRGIWPIRISGSNSVAAMIRVAAEGYGICAVPSLFAKYELFSDELRALRCEVDLPGLDFFVTHRTDTFNDVAILVADIALDTCREPVAPVARHGSAVDKTQ